MWSYFAPFLRYGDLLAENCVFFLPLCYSASPLPMFPLEFRGKVGHKDYSSGRAGPADDRITDASRSVSKLGGRSAPAIKRARRVVF